MNFKDWLTETGMTMHALSKLCGLSPTTIINISIGKPVTPRTIKKMMKATKYFKTPIAPEMFPRVYLHGKDEIVSGPMAFARELRKQFKGIK
jgi:transcriptional regulator with XRE-family HTH domain